MSLYGSSVEMALHCLLNLAGRPAESSASTRDLAEFQGVSASFVAKLFTRLEKAGLVAAAQGAAGGFRLARPAAEITVRDVVDAVEPAKPLFQCRDIRRNCVLYDETPPPWATSGICGIHAVFLDAEIAMRERLAQTTLQDIAAATAAKIPERFFIDADDWFDGRKRGPARTKTGESK
jgi:Rrf2 family protein